MECIVLNAIQSLVIVNNHKYRQYAIGSVSNRQKPVSEELEIPDGVSEWYSSYVFYDSDVIVYWDENGRIGGFKGDVCSEIVPIDIDSSDLDESLRICRELTERLWHVFEVDKNNINIFFSGNKGYHVELSSSLFGITPTPHSEFCKRLKWICTELHDEIDEALYKPHMQYRVGNTINAKSGLYKIPITYDELHSLSTAEIQELAKSSRIIENQCFHDCTVNDTLESMWIQSEEEVQKSHPDTLSTPTFTLNIPNGVPQGERNAQCFNIALNCKSYGKTIDETKELIFCWNQTNNPPEEKIYELMRTVESAFSYDTAINSLVSFKYHIREDTLYNSMSKDYKNMYIYLLCNLNDKENIWKGVTIKQNQWIFSNRTFAGAVGVSIQKVRTFIAKLEDVERIIVEVVQLESKGFNNSQLLTWLL